MLIGKCQQYSQVVDVLECVYLGNYSSYKKQENEHNQSYTRYSFYSWPKCMG